MWSVTRKPRRRGCLAPTAGEQCSIDEIMNALTRITTVLAVALVTATAGGQSNEGSQVDLLKQLRAEHPRLIVLDKDVERTRELIASDPVAQSYLEELRREARKILKQQPVHYELVGPRLLTQSRRCLHRVSTLAAL